MNYILFHDNSCESGRTLKEALRIDGGTQDPGRVDKLIRWGNRMQIAKKPGRILNERGAMDIASNKDRFLRFAQDNNIPCPPIVNRFSGELLLARKSQHSGGSGAYFITSQHEFDLAKNVVNCTTFMKYVPVSREFRIHVFGGEAFFAYERKCPSNPVSLNIKNQWDEERVDLNRLPNGMKEIAEEAVESCNLDFAGVDICLSVNNGIYIFELNTAPALVKSNGDHLPSFNFYKDRFMRWLDGD